MSISFERNGKWVKLQEFSNKDVIDYLASKLNINNPHFRVVAKPRFCNGVMAKFDVEENIVMMNSKLLLSRIVNFMVHY